MAAAVFQPAHTLLAEVDVAVQLAHDQQVDLAGDFGTQGGQVFKACEDLRRTQVRKEAKFLAQAQDGLLRAQMAFQVVAGEIAHGAEQDRLGRARDVQRFGGKRMAMLVVGRAADVALDQLQARKVELLEHPHRLLGDLGTDPVSCKNRDAHVVLRLLLSHESVPAAHAARRATP